MAHAQVGEERDVVVSMGGIPCTVHVSVANTYAVTLDFLYHGKPYVFAVTTWSGSGQARFLRVFHDGTNPRDEATFGRIEVDDVGELRAVPTVPQRREMVVQATIDVLANVDRVLKEHGRSAIDYAVWYREQNADEVPYARYIAKIAAEFIVHANFLAPAIPWHVVL